MIGKTSADKDQEHKHMPPPKHAVHGSLRRDLEHVPVGAGVEGKFGRMFGLLGSLPDDDETLAKLMKLGDAMAEPNPGDGGVDDPAGDNPTIPAGYTYLGQFIDHDITFDPTSLPESAVDPLSLSNFRTPLLELDSLYGAGPFVQPHLYDRDGELFIIGKTSATPGRGDDKVRPNLEFDLPRASQGLAIIPDPRNDENLIVAQLHLAFMRFHNEVVKALRNRTIPRTEPLQKSLFEEARRIVTWHYQWIVLHDFLPRILDRERLAAALVQREHYKPEGYAFIPVEFAAGAYRLGHSMVRSVYDYNRVFSLDTRTQATLGLLFFFSGRSGSSVPIPSDWVADFRRLFEIDPQIKPGLSRKLDGRIAHFLANLPPQERPRSLAKLNLQRGLFLGLPTGQAVARKLGLPVLTPAQIEAAGPDGAVAAQLHLHAESPLWYYILKEAEIMAEGKHLGPTGSTIVAEVFVGLLQKDPHSFLSLDPNWKPTLPSKVAGSFDMADLLRFAGNVAPVDDPAHILP